MMPAGGDPQRETHTYVHAFDDAPDARDEELRTLLGGKGANLVVMARDLGLPVPPGFTITTDACRAYLGGRWPSGLDDEIRAHLDRLGGRVGRRFGDPADPLLVSVRSGAPVSMPGMMDTILNVGLNAESAVGLARGASGGDAFADDCLRRLRDGYLGVLGTDEVPDDPWAQLRAAIEAVFRSWESDRARAYRRRERIADDLGTAVTIQAMVFGNRGAESGTGVAFTRDPSTGEPRLYGDVMFDAQGEDVVAGGYSPEPIGVLDERLPEVAHELRRHAEVLEHHYADLCDIEFTIEDRRLWILQVRVGKRSPRAALRMAIDMGDDDAFPLSRADAVRRVAAHLADPPRLFARDAPFPPAIAVGLPASPGVATGTVVTSSEAAEAAGAAGESVILVRAETSPEDVAGMARAAGVLTARGGLASHAAVVARGWGIPAVVGAEVVRPGTDHVEIDGHVIHAGERITIDGTTGEVHLGELPGHWEEAPEVATLRAWAAELGIEIVTADGEASTSEDAVSDRSLDGTEEMEVGSADLLRALLVKGTIAMEDLGDVVLAAPDDVRPLAEQLLDEGLAERSGDGIRLTAEGKLAASDLMIADRAAIGEVRTIELLGSFHPFDVRMKGLVTAWQIRDVAGEQVLNDHTDGAYDTRVIEDLGALHREVIEWLASLAGAMRPFAVYRARLTCALERLRSGDERYVASPRVDSYHSVWFELHEDLIRLAGRRRSDEAAAGRA